MRTGNLMRNVLACVLCGLLLAGCGRVDNPYQVDTVVRIPVDPTDVPAQPEETVPPTETEAPTEPAEQTDAPEETEAPAATAGKNESSGKKSASQKKPASSKKPSSGSSKEPVKSTEPAQTEAPATVAPTEIPPTEVPETEPPTEPPYDPSDYSIGSLEKTVLKEINAVRTEAGLAELSMDRRLCGIAALRAEEAGAVWSHTRPDGRDYASAMADYGFGFSMSAENLAHSTGSGDGAAIVAKWMDTGSGQNILSENFTTVGIGISRAGGVTVVACLLAG